jgi:hypothetical protein
MPPSLTPEATASSTEHDHLRTLARSPHPYHHQSYELPHLSDRFQLRNGTALPHRKEGGDAKSPSSGSGTAYSTFSKESTPGSESGTEADDEHFLKGLPAPKVKPHKGLRGRNEPLSGTSSPLPSPAILGQSSPTSDRRFSTSPERTSLVLDALRRKKILVRRATEAGIVIALGCLVRSNRQVAPLATAWSKGRLIAFRIYSSHACLLKW